MNILIAGDYCPRERVAASFEIGDYATVFPEVRELTSKVDFSIVNFECPVANNVEKPIEKCGPNLHCTLNGVKAIKWAGFNCVTLANNHFLDYGEEGVKETIASLKSNGIEYVGGGKDLEEASKTLYKTFDGYRLAIINCCEHEFSIATDKTAGSNPLNPIQQYYAIKEARKNAERVLVIVHGGHEHFQLPSLRMVDTYRFFVDAGADVVVNHHQHCYSGYEVYKGKPIFYGLGNFCFDNPSRHVGPWTEGYAVMIDFNSESPTFELHPYSQCADEPCVNLLTKSAFEQRLEELNKIIANNTMLKDETEKYYASLANKYNNILEPIYNHYYFVCKNRGWLPSLISNKRKLLAENYICCESHRDILKYWLEWM